MSTLNIYLTKFFVKNFEIKSKFNRCADRSLCKLNGGKLTVNPSTRLALKGLCIEFCPEDPTDMNYQWSVKDK